MVRHRDHDDFGPAQQGCFDSQGRLVVQQVFPPMARHEFRNDHREDVLRLRAAHAVNLIQEGLHDLAIGAADGP